MYRNPLPSELNSPVFNAVWDVIKSWDINVPSEYEGYCGATGNHVAAIIDALKLVEEQNTPTNNEPANIIERAEKCANAIVPDAQSSEAPVQHNSGTEGHLCA